MIKSHELAKYLLESPNMEVRASIDVINSERVFGTLFEPVPHGKEFFMLTFDEIK